MTTQIDPNNPLPITEIMQTLRALQEQVLHLQERQEETIRSVLLALELLEKSHIPSQALQKCGFY
jgi:hypothetical protein